MRLLYLDCFAGAAGDMLLGALVDASGDPAPAVQAVASTGVGGIELSFERVERAGLPALKAAVRVAAATGERRLGDLLAAVDRCGLDPRAAERARRAFRLLAEAEGAVHGDRPEEVHLHEVGALDALADVVGTCAAWARLAPGRTVAQVPPAGEGLVRGSHGPLPVPAPAVVEIARLAGVPLAGGGRGETLTPTGAALLGALVDEFGPMPEMTVEAAGYGAGTRDPAELPNVVRALVGRARVPAEPALVVDANIDDATPELLAHALSRLLEAGAQDAWITPVVMKKGRPGHKLSFLCTRSRLDPLLDLLFAETTTLGARVSEVAKQTLERSWVTVTVGGHELRVKLARRSGRVVGAAAEHEDAARVAAATGLPLKEVHRLALEAARATVAAHQGGDRGGGGAPR